MIQMAILKNIRLVYLLKVSLKDEALTTKKLYLHFLGKILLLMIFAAYFYYTYTEDECLDYVS